MMGMTSFGRREGVGIFAPMILPEHARPSILIG